MRAGDVVWVAYPYVEDDRWKSRPALVVATGLGVRADLFWALMITSAANRAWPGDHPVGDPVAAGLPIPSVVRTQKIATLPIGSATVIGRLPDTELPQVSNLVSRHFGMDRPA